ncbi:hypothetical protein BV22DRAFT_549799 [Leucogyrophana mollusca]|uniref:Uncharacterized protein n=1 Tax=Leucogyrophana mollusca TaxID=85980 RepID=A0ACB8BDX5_9AGAM|nr:hypothetical protein BV22DRAFT_549799 [Leucogyrophana mollusca]
MSPMSIMLSSLGVELYDLPPSKRKAKLSAFWLALAPEQRILLQDEINPKSSEIPFGFTPHDGAYLLRTSKSLAWAFEVLKATSHKEIIVAAIKVISFTWMDNPSVLAAAIGGDEVEGIVQLINTTMPQYSTSLFFRYLSRSPLTVPHSRLVDGILTSIFPFLSTGSPTPITRYARVALSSLFVAASRPVLLSIIRQCAAQWFDHATWRHLAIRRPEVVGDILLEYIGAPRLSTDISLEIGVEHPKQLFSILDIVIKQPNSAAFATAFLSQYASYATDNLANHDARLKSGDYPTLKSLAKHVAFLLRRRTDPNNVCSIAISQCKVFAKICAAYGVDEWSWSMAQPLIDIAVDEFGRSPDEWLLVSAGDASSLADTASPTGYLLNLLKHLAYDDKTVYEEYRPWKYLRRLPRPGRFPFLNFLHIAKTGEDLLRVPPTPSLVPKCSPNNFELLHPEHMPILLDVGTKSRDKFFGSSPPDRAGISFNVDLGSLWCFQAADLRAPGATAAGLRAMQTGATRTAFRLSGMSVGHRDEETERDVEELKKQASRSKDWHSDFVCAALSIGIMSQSPSLFVDTLSWTVNRYAKDPHMSPKLHSWIMNLGNDNLIRFIAGPSGLFACKRTRGMLDAVTLRAWCEITNRAIAISMSLLRVWISEPDHQVNINYEYGTFKTFLIRVIKERFALIGVLYPTLFDNLSELQQVFLVPLIEYWMQWEHLRIVEHPKLLRFNSIFNVPCLIEEFSEELKVDRHILPSIIPFIESIGQERETLYLAHRSSFPEPDESLINGREAELLGDERSSRHFLPFGLEINRPSRSSQGVLVASGPLWDYVEGVVFKGAHTSLHEQTDRFDWHPSQFSSALRTFFELFPGTGGSKARALLLAYSQGHHACGMATALILRSSSIQPLLWRDEELCQYMASFLPQYPADNAPHGDFDPLALMPSAVRSKLEVTSQLIVLRNVNLSEKDLFLILFPKRGLRGASLHTKHRFAVFAIAFILTILGIPRPKSNSFSGGITDYALHNVRVSRSFIDKWNSTRDRKRASAKASPATFACNLLSFVLPALSGSDLRRLLTVVFSASSSLENLTTQVLVLSTVRGLAVPGLGREQALQIIQDARASSWHRQVVTIDAIKAYRPPDAKVYVLHLLSFSQEQRAAQEDRMQIDDAHDGDDSDLVFSEGSSDIALSEDGSDAMMAQVLESAQSGPAIKMSTQKMFIQLLAPLFRQGVLDGGVLMGYAQSGLLEVPAAITSCVVKTVAEIAVTTFVITSGNGDSAWAVLSPFVGIAQRLDERSPLLPNTWDLARTGSGPMPVISEERPVATALLEYGQSSMSPCVRKAWAQSVVDPILTGHLAERTLWLKCAVARESGPVDLQESMVASYGDGIPFPAVVKRFAPYVESDVWKASENRAVGYLFRDRCQNLHDLVAANHPKGWESELYGKSLISLTWFAIKEGSSSPVLATMANTAQDSSISEIPRDRAIGTLLRVGFTMLSPENMLKPISHPPGRPFAPFMDFLARHMTSARDAQTERLLVCYLGKAEEHELRLSEDKVHGGACYWRLIVILKLLLARFRAEVCSPVESPSGRKYAEDVASIATILVEKGWRHANFPYQYHPFLQCAKLPANEIIASSRELTLSPLCPSEPGALRSMFLEAAAALLQANKQAVKHSATATRALEGLMNEWKNASDGALAWLAVAWEELAAADLLHVVRRRREWGSESSSMYL